MQRRIQVDLDGLNPVTRNKYMQYGVIPLLKFVHKNNLPLSLGSLLEFSRELQTKGKGPGLVSSAFNGLKILLVGFQKDLSWEDNKSYLNRFTKHKRAFEARDKRTWTYPLSWEDIQFLLPKNPKGCNLLAWKRFLIIGWVFLLRKNEITRVKPKHLIIKRNKNNKVVEVTLLVQNNKNCTNKKESLAVTFPREQIPEELIPELCEIAKFQGNLWKGLSHTNIILPHLKNIMHGRYDESYYKVVIHSMRHGRSEHLYTKHKLANEKLQQVGRWSTTAGRNAYKHS